MNQDAEEPTPVTATSLALDVAALAAADRTSALSRETDWSGLWFDLIEKESWLIGSTCSGDAGYFIIRDLDDLEIGTAHIVSRAKRSFVRVAALRRAARERFSEAEVLRLFPLEEVS